MPSARYEVIESKRPWKFLSPQVRTTIGLAGASSTAVGVRKLTSFATDQKSQHVLALFRSACTEPSVETNIGILSRRRLHRSLNRQCRTGRSLRIASNKQPCWLSVRPLIGGLASSNGLGGTRVPFAVALT